MKFTLGNAMNPAGLTVVPDSMAYAAGKYGFDMNTKPMAYEGDALGVHSDKPFAFSAALPEGNYKVTVTVGGPQESTTTLLAESRRLMAEKIHTDAGKTQTVDFVVNIRNSKVPPPPTNAPGGSEVRLNSLDNPITWDDKLTLEFTGTNPAVQTIQIEPATVPTIFIMGDSTVTDQPRDPGASWGQMLPVFFKDTVAVANHATSGETMKSSITGLRLDKVLSQAKRGDYLLIQYGHNDEKQSWPQTYVEPETTFKAYIGVFIAEARRRGVTPVIISPMERRTGTTPDANSHGGFPKAYAEVAAEQKVAFVDLWSKSKLMYAAMGNDVGAAFNDATHHKTYGAYELARIVATGLHQGNLELTKHFKDDFKDFDPVHPDAAASFTVPFNIALNGRPPQGN
ncbi:MAG TPA: rhamnogalacturonan acetylesterase [Phycisphaerae bacterium]|nr:rhamnogalacturonan acetylesterase [Phycisphaerae bacterium]